jgi:membrane glycosyltransferase
LIQAILLFAGAPMYLLFLIAAATAAATDTVSEFPAHWALALTGVWLGALYAPKLLGYVEVALSPDKRARYGGPGRFGVGVAAEIGFTLLLDAVSTVAKTGAMLRLALGGRVAWRGQNRSDRGVGWGEAIQLLWPQTVLGIVAFGAFALADWAATLWALPLAGGLLVSIPLCVLTADPRFGRWLRERQIASIPEELSATPRGQPTPALALQDSD